jgi:hypothetical protein
VSDYVAEEKWLLAPEHLRSKCAERGFSEALTTLLARNNLLPSQADQMPDSELLKLRLFGSKRLHELRSRRGLGDLEEFSALGVWPE